MESLVSNVSTLNGRPVDKPGPDVPEDFKSEDPTLHGGRYKPDAGWSYNQVWSSDRYPHPIGYAWYYTPNPGGNVGWGVGLGGDNIPRWSWQPFYDYNEKSKPDLGLYLPSSYEVFWQSTGRSNRGYWTVHQIDTSNASSGGKIPEMTSFDTYSDVDFWNRYSHDRRFRRSRYRSYFPASY